MRSLDSPIRSRAGCSVLQVDFPFGQGQDVQSDGGIG